MPKSSDEFRVEFVIGSVFGSEQKLFCGRSEDAFALENTEKPVAHMSQLRPGVQLPRFQFLLEKGQRINGPFQLELSHFLFLANVASEIPRHCRHGTLTQQ